MPGMGSGLSNNDPLIVAAFHRALLHQGFIVLAIAAIVAVAWNLLRSAGLRGADAGAPARPLGQPQPPGPAHRLESAAPEPAGRRWLRISFGLLWIFDGVLQGQASMPLGLPSDVVQPAASTSPAWTQHLVNAGIDVWSYHPVAAAAAAVWIQIGIGIWLLAAPRGNWSRLAGVAGAGWGLIIWVFGEAFGGIFAPGLTWLFGAPGAVLFYAVAGAIIALPERHWIGPRLGRLLLGGLGLFFLGMGVLQAWPGRGSWQGSTLSAMVRQMAQTPQPHLLSSWVATFGRFDRDHGWGVNLFCVTALVVCGMFFLAARWRPALRTGVAIALVVGLADWVLVEDLGFMGGVGTDPNSMVPMLLLVIAGYITIARPAAAPAPATERETGHRPWRAVVADRPAYVFRLVAALGALAITLVGAAPMALAVTNRHADSIITRAVNGAPTTTSAVAPAFSLIDEHARPVSLSGLRGKTVALTFLDPVCTSDCPTIAQEFKQADQMLGERAAGVEFLAIDLNPTYRSSDYLAAFDQTENLAGLTNWHFLTGTLAELRQVWRAYGVVNALAPGGAMVAHSDLAFVIDANGVARYSFDADPGPGTKASTASFAASLRDAIKNA